MNTEDHRFLGIRDLRPYIVEPMQAVYLVPWVKLDSQAGIPTPIQVIDQYSFALRMTGNYECSPLSSGENGKCPAESVHWIPLRELVQEIADRNVMDDTSENRVKIDSSEYVNQPEVVDKTSADISETMLEEKASQLVDHSIVINLGVSVPSQPEPVPCSFTNDSKYSARRVFYHKGRILSDFLVSCLCNIRLEQEIESYLADSRYLDAPIVTVSESEGIYNSTLISELIAETANVSLFAGSESKDKAESHQRHDIAEKAGADTQNPLEIRRRRVRIMHRDTNIPKSRDGNNLDEFADDLLNESMRGFS